MATSNTCLARQLAHAFQITSRPTPLPAAFLLPFPPRSQLQLRHASKVRTKAKPKEKKKSNTYEVADLRRVPQFSLLDAMRYLKASEVGRAPTSSKYELAISLRTLRNSAVIRGRIRLPHAVGSDLRVAVIVDPESKEGKASIKSGAFLVGEEHIFDKVKAGEIEFDRLICHVDSLPKLQKAGLGRILGPKGLMPSAKLGTVLKDVATAITDSADASEYRERTGVIRMAVGQLGFTPEELQSNIKAVMEAIKRDAAYLSDTVSKEVHEVVLSSTNGPGMSLNGTFKGASSLDSRALSVV